MKKFYGVILVAVLCFFCTVIFAACSAGKDADKCVWEYVYDEQSGGYIVSGVRAERYERLEIPKEIDGMKVEGVSCAIFEKENVSEIVFGGEVFFTDTHKLADVNPNGIKLFAEKTSIDGIRAELYKCANDEAVRENALALANGVALTGLDSNENYISFDYDWQAYSACGGNVLPVFICSSGDVFDLDAYAADYGYIVHCDKTSVFDLNRAYSCANGWILDDVTIDGVSVFGGYTLYDNSVAKVRFERVYRIYVGEGNDENYDLTKVQPDFCYDELLGEQLAFRYVAESAADELLSEVILRNGFALNWEYSVRTDAHNSVIEKLKNLSSALAKEKSDLNIYPVWSVKELGVKILSSDEDNVITYGDNVIFSAQTIGLNEDVTLVYEWRHNGEIICTERTLNLEKTLSDGRYDGVYEVKVTLTENGIGVAYAQTEVTLNILKRAVSVVWEESNIYYNGQEQFPSAYAYGVFGEKLLIEVLGGGINAGAHKATAVIHSPYYSLVNEEKNFKILKAPLTVKARDCSAEYGSQPKANGVEYDGFKSGDDESVLKGTLAYSYTNTSSHVGIYADCVHISGLSADNYEINYVGGCLEIAPRAVELSWEGYNNLVYDGEVHYIAAVARDISAGDDVSVELSGGCAVNAGDYTATAYLIGKDAGNYVLTGSTSFDFTVAKADITLAVHIEDTEYGSELSPSVTGNSGNGEVAYSYVTAQCLYGASAHLSVGTHYVSAMVEETENYNSAVAASSFRIIPREVFITWKNFDNLVYNSEAKSVSAEIGNALLGDSVYISVTGGDGINAGSYIAVAGLEGEDAENYRLPQMYTCAYEIEKCTVSIVAESKTSVYSERFEELTAVVYGTVYNGEVSYTLRKEEGVDAGVYAIDVVVGEYSNYEIQTVSAKYIITKKTPTIDGAVGGKIQLQECVAYGTTLSALTDRLPSASVAGSWAWADGEHATVGETGQKSFAVTFRPKDNNNYSEVKTEVCIYVKKVNAFEVTLGSADETSQYADQSVPYRLALNGGFTVIDFIFSGKWYKIIKDRLMVSVACKDGASTNAEVSGMSAIFRAAGEYILTFECKENEEYMSAKITITVIVE